MHNLGFIDILGPQTHACKTCGKEFTHLSNLIRHRRQHEEKSSFQCDQCSSSFKNQSSLDTHLAMHRGRKLFPCSSCNKLFRSKKGLQYHEKNHPSVKDHVCNTCQKYFSSAQSLKEHRVVHNKAKSFVCGGCNSAFTLKSNLKRHLKICHKEPVLKCQYCDQIFESTSSLQYHESIHTGKRLVCDNCGFTCRSNSALKKHKCHSTEGKKAKMVLADVEENASLSTPKSSVKSATAKRKYTPGNKKEIAAKRKKLEPNSPKHTDKTKSNTSKGKKSALKEKPLVIKFNIKKPKKRLVAPVFDNNTEDVPLIDEHLEESVKTGQNEPEVSLDESLNSSGTHEGETHRRKSSTPRKISVTDNDSTCSELDSFLKTEESNVDMAENIAVIGTIMTKDNQMLHGGPN